MDKNLTPEAIASMYKQFAESTVGLFMRGQWEAQVEIYNRASYEASSNYEQGKYTNRAAALVAELDTINQQVVLATHPPKQFTTK